ncbi:MAG: hypothetical protein ACKV2T_23885 [Kofleriaceae bacterium]
MGDPNLIKVCLTNKGEDTETPWAADLGPAGSDGSRKVKLVNVPFMHAKPTWGDTIVVRPARNDGHPTWDRDGVPWKQIATKIVEDGGRWAMIIDYLPATSAEEAFAALGRACDDAKIVCEGAWGPRDHDPGRVYLAVQKELTAEHVMGILVGASLPMELIQIHPEPKKKQRAQTVVGISDEAGRPPAKRAKTEPPTVAKSGASKPARSETSAAMKANDTSAAKKVKPIANAVPAAKSVPKKAAKAEPAKPAAKPPTKPAAKAAPAKPVAKAAPAKPAAKAAPAKPAAKAPPAKAAPAKSAPKPAAKPVAKAAPAKPAPMKPATKAPTKPPKKK